MNFESDDSNDRKENLNTTVTQTKISRRSSILKTTDFDSKLIDEITGDETTRIRKLRRVSFSHNIQVKTIDDLHAKPNDSITESNTLANARTSIKRSDLKKLNDVTNSKTENTTIINNVSVLETTHNVSVLPFNMSVETDPMVNSMNTTNNESVVMEITMGLNETNVLKDDHDKSLEKSFEESLLLNNDPSETIHEVIDQTINKTMDSPPMKQTPALTPKNMTYEVLEANSTIKSQYNDDYEYERSEIRINETVTIQGITNKTYNALQEPSIVNKTFDLEKTQVINKTMDIEPEKDTTKLPSHSFLTSASFIQSSTMINEKNKSINKSNINLSVLNETVSNCADLISNNNQNIENEMDLLKERCDDLKNRIKTLMSKVVEQNQVKREQIEKIIEENARKRDEIDRKRAQTVKIQLEIEKMRLEASKDAKMCKILTLSNENNLKKNQNEMKNLGEKNKNNEKELRDAQKKLDNLKDAVDIGFDQIKSLRNERNEKEKLIKLYKKLFDHHNMDFSVVNFDQDTINLSFFNDLIQVQIKVMNLVNDLACKISADPNESSEMLFEDINKKLKYLNYPIKTINMKTSVDSYGNKMMNRKSRVSLSNKYSKNKVPLFVRFCISLILGEFRLDQDGNLILAENNFKFVRDLPIFIARMKLACNSATNLAKDLEELMAKTENSCLKIEFDIKNFIMSFYLPSLEDSCFYNLRLNVEPGLYYQLPIEFKIDQNGLDEPFEPNMGKISKLLEDQFFVDGSLKSYFKKLNVF